MTGRERPPVYADEDVDRPLTEALRERGFDVLTAGEAGLLGAPDERQLEHATSLGRALVSLNRLHFRRLHARWRADGRRHAGIIVLPQQGPIARRGCGRRCSSMRSQRREKPRCSSAGATCRCGCTAVSGRRATLSRRYEWRSRSLRRSHSRPTDRGTTTSAAAP